MGNSPLFNISKDYIDPKLFTCLKNGGNLLVIPDTIPILHTVKPDYILRMVDKDNKVYYRKVKHVTYSISLAGPIRMYGIKKFDPTLKTNEQGIDLLKEIYEEEYNRYIVLVLDFYIYK